MSGRSTKRKRSTTSQLFPPDSTRALLAAAAKNHPDVAATITKEVDRLAGVERSKVVEFDHLSKAAWKEINVKYSGLNGTRQYEGAGEAYRQVREYLEEIQQGCPPTASFKTKQNALETCRKIGKTIALSGGDTCPREVQKLFGTDETLPTVMMKIAQSLREEERASIMDNGWGEKLEELVDLSKGYYLFESLPELLALMDEEESEEEP